MGRGILIGVIWGGLVSIVVLINVSLLSPLPVVVEDGALRPAPRGAEVGDLPDAGSPAAEGDGVIAPLPEAGADPVPTPAQPDPRDQSSAVDDGTSVPSAAGNGATEPRIGLEAPAGEVIPRAPEGIERQTTRVDPQIAPGIDLPAGSEFARARPDVTPALPGIDGAPASAAGSPAGLPRSAAPTATPQPDTAPPVSPQMLTAPGRGLEQPADETEGVDAPQAAMQADPAPQGTGPVEIARDGMVPDTDPAAPLPPAETPATANSAVTTAPVGGRDAAPQVATDSAAPQVSASVNARMVGAAAPMQPVPSASESGIFDSRTADMVQGAPLGPIQPIQAFPVAGTQADAGPAPGTLDPVAIQPGDTEPRARTPQLDPLTGAPVAPAAPTRLFEVSPETVPGISGDQLDPATSDADRPRIVTDQLLREDESAPVAGVITGRLPTIGAEPAPQEAAAADALPTDLPADETEAASMSRLSSDTLPALTRYAMPFSNPLQLPLLSVVLIDVPGGMGPEGLANLPFTVSVAVDPERDDLALRVAAYRAQGHEVLLLGRDVAGALGDRLAGVEGVVALLEPDAGGFGTSRIAAQDAALIAGRDGQGMVLWDRGLNGALREAEAQNVPAALIFRALDDAREDAPLIERYMDRAAFEAIKTGSVIMIGRTYPDTLTALMGWSDGARAEDVALAPVSAILNAAPESDADADAGDSASDG